MPFMFYFVLFWESILCGMIAGTIYGKKGHSYWSGFFCGYILNVIGILVCALDSNNPDTIEEEKYRNLSSPTQEIEKLLKLKESGVITEDEFEESKEKILNKL